MTKLEMRFLGGIQFSLDGTNLVDFRSKKGQALLCYLAVTEQSHSRVSLAGLLWPESSEENARASLRKVLTEIRKKVPLHLNTTRQTVAIDADVPIWVDVIQFEKLVKATSDIDRLQEAVSLYQGNFLERFFLPDASAFDGWTLGQRARLRQMALAALNTLITHFADLRAYETAVSFARQLLEIEPWREGGHRQLMQFLALSGQRNVALKQYERCCLILAEELGIEPTAETTALYERILDGTLAEEDRNDLLPADGNRKVLQDSLLKPSHNLPADLTPFVGREQELEQLNQLLADERTRLISVVGMGGIGKTRLAREAGRRQVADFKSGVFFVPLVQVSSPDNIPSAIADATGFQFHSTDAPLKQLINYLRQKQMLLILDNFEHLISGCTVVSDILRGAPHVKIMVTSRQQLPLRGDTRLNLLGMDVGQGANAHQALAASAVRLFLQSAQRSQPEFVLDDENFQLVLAICTLVQGMPLGIELAASWVDTLTLEEIKEGIEQEIEFLTADFHDAPERHRNLQRLMEQSLRILSEKELDVFLRLCVFRGGFTRDAAQQVAKADIRTLATLVSKSLVHRDMGGRYAIHELLRQFGEMSLNSDVDVYDRVRNDHAGYYCQFLGALEDELNTGAGKSACTQIEAEWGNVHLAWEWACLYALFDDLIKAEYAIFLFREYQNRFQEVEQMYDFAVSHLTAFKSNPKRDYLLSSVLRSQSWTAVRYGQIELGLELGAKSWNHFLESNLPLRRGCNDPRAPLTVLHTLIGNFETARQIGMEMLHYHCDRGDSITKILTYYALSTLELAEGHYRQVRQYGRDAVADFEATGHKYLYAYFLNNWGNAERALENYGEANRLFRESYNLMRDLGSTEGMTTALNNVANIALLQEEYDEAQNILEQNVITYRDLGDPGGIAMTLEALGRLAMRRKDVAQAAQLYSEALQTAGASLSSITLSILIRVSRLFLESNLRKQAGQIIALVIQHPASNQEISERAQDQLNIYDLDPGAKNEIVALENLVGEVIQQLNIHDWKTMS